jgi:chromosome segregation ATPase
MQTHKDMLEAYRPLSNMEKPSKSPLKVAQRIEEYAQESEEHEVIGESLEMRLSELFTEIDTLDRQIHILQSSIEDAITSGADHRTLEATLTETETLLLLKREEAQSIHTQYTQHYKRDSTQHRQEAAQDTALRPPPAPPSSTSTG